MNYASEAFSAFIRPLTQRSNSRPGNERTQNPPRRANSYSGTTHYSEAGSRDLEEDGFLVVGETQSERTTIKTQDFQGDIDQPPEYNQSEAQEDNLPSYMDYKQSQGLYQPWSQAPTIPPAPHPPGGGTTQLEDDPYNTIALSQGALKGVTFTLAPYLQNIVTMTSDVNRNLGMKYSTFDPSKYEYEFDLEMRVLSEHGLYN